MSDPEKTTPGARGLRLPNDGPIPGPESNPTREETAMSTETTDQPTTDTTATEPESTEPNDAKRYRLQLREAEAERDSLRTVVESMRRQEAERLTEGRIVSPKLIWTLGKGAADLLTEDGNGVDPEKVKALCDAVVAEYGDGVKSRRSGAPYVPLEGRSPSYTGPWPREKGLASAFTPGASED